MRATLLLAFLIYSPSEAAQSPWAEKPYGVLLVGPDGGADWKAFTEQAKKAAGKDVPLEAFAGPLEPKGLQKAVDRLTAAKARKVCVVPVFLHAQSMELEQLRYLLGLEKLPSRRFLEAWGMERRVVARVKTKAALVLAAPLGADPAVGEVLLSRALERRPRGRLETALLVGAGAEADEENAARLAELEKHAERMAASKELAGARAWLLRPAAEKKPRQAAESEKGLKDLAGSLSRSGRVVVVPVLLTRDGSLRAWRRVLDNPFLRWAEKGLLPDERLARWAQERAAAARSEPDQARFKDDGQALPPQERKR